MKKEEHKKAIKIFKSNIKYLTTLDEDELEKEISYLICQTYLYCKKGGQEHLW